MSNNMRIRVCCQALCGETDFTCTSIGKSPNFWLLLGANISNIRSLRNEICARMQFLKPSSAILELDGFLLPLSDSIQLLRDGDIIVVRVVSEENFSVDECNNVSQSSQTSPIHSNGTYTLQRNCISRKSDTLGTRNDNAAESEVNSDSQLHDNNKEDKKTKKKKKLDENTKNKKSNKRKRAESELVDIGVTSVKKNRKCPHTEVQPELIYSTKPKKSKKTTVISQTDTSLENSQPWVTASCAPKETDENFGSCPATADDHSFRTQNSNLDDPQDPNLLVPKKRKRARKRKRNKDNFNNLKKELISTPQPSPDKRPCKGVRFTNSSISFPRSMPQHASTPHPGQSARHVHFDSEEEHETTRQQTMYYSLPPSSPVQEEEEAEVEPSFCNDIGNSYTCVDFDYTKDNRSAPSDSNLMFKKQRKRNKRKGTYSLKTDQLNDTQTNISSIYQNPPVADDNPTVLKDYSLCPDLQGPPRISDKIAYKILEIGEDYCPSVSKYKTAVVLKFDVKSQSVELQPLDKLSTAIRRNGKFEIDLENDIDDDSPVVITLASMIEPKLIIDEDIPGVVDNPSNQGGNKQSAYGEHSCFGNVANGNIDVQQTLHNGNYSKNNSLTNTTEGFLKDNESSRPSGVGANTTEDNIQLVSFNTSSVHFL